MHLLVLTQLFSNLNVKPPLQALPHVVDHLLTGPRILRIVYSQSEKGKPRCS